MAEPQKRDASALDGDNNASNEVDTSVFGEDKSDDDSSQDDASTSPADHSSAAPARKKVKKSRLSGLVDDQAQESDGEGGDVDSDGADSSDEDSYEDDGFVKKTEDDSDDDSESSEDERTKLHRKKRMEKKKQDAQKLQRFTNIGAQPSVDDLELIRGRDSDDEGDAVEVDGNGPEQGVDAEVYDEDIEDDDQDPEQKFLELGFACFGPDYAEFAGMHDIDKEKLQLAMGRRTAAGSDDDDDDDEDEESDDDQSENGDSSRAAGDSDTAPTDSADATPAIAPQATPAVTRFDPQVDLPERFSTGPLKSCLVMHDGAPGAPDADFTAEAQWVVQQLASKWPFHALPEGAVETCARILNAIAVEHVEVPYIMTYRSQHAKHFLPAQLWAIQDLHEEWCATQELSQVVSRALQSLDAAATQTIETQDNGAATSDGSAKATNSNVYVSRMLVAGQYPYQLLPSDKKNLRVYLNFIKMFDGLTASTVAEASKTSNLRRQGNSARGKLNANRNFLVQCHTAGVLGLQHHLGIYPGQVASNYEAVGYQAAPPTVVVNVQSGLDDLIAELCSENRTVEGTSKFRDFADADGAMRAFEKSCALFLAYEPRLRSLVIHDLITGATLNTEPTTRGVEEISNDPFHHLFGVHRLRGKPVEECWYQAPSFEAPRHIPGSFGAPDVKDPYDTPPPSSAATAGQRVDRRNKPEPRWDTALRGTTYARVRQGVEKGYLKVDIQLQTVDKAINKLRQAFLTPKHFQLILQDAPVSQESKMAGWDEFRERVVQRTIREYLAPAAKATLREKLTTESETSIATHCASVVRDLVRYQPSRPAQHLPGVTLPHTLNGATLSGALWVQDDVGIDEKLAQLQYNDYDDDVPTHQECIGCFYAVDSRREPSFFAVLNRSGDVLESLELESWSRHASYQENVYPKVRRLISLYGLRVIALNPCRQADFIKRELESLAADVAAKAQVSADAAAAVVYTDPFMAVLMARSPQGKQEFPKDHINKRLTIYLGRMAQNPLLEMCVFTNFAGSDVEDKARMLKRLDLHRFQKALPSRVLVKHVERVLISEVNRVGVDINSLLNLKPSRALAILQYVSGLGRNRAAQLIAEGNERDGICNREELTEFLPKTVVRNAAGFIAIRPWHFDPMTLNIGLAANKRHIQWTDDHFARFQPLDATRIHPELYPRVITALEQVHTTLQLNREDTNASKRVILELLWESSEARRQKRIDDADRASQPAPLVLGAGSAPPTDSYFDPIQLNKSVVQLPNLGTQARLIYEELQWPFADSRPATPHLSDARLYELAVGDSDESLRRGMLITVKVTRVSFYDGAHGSDQSRDPVRGRVRSALQEVIPNRQALIDTWIAKICNSRSGDVECGHRYAVDTVLKFLDRLVRRVDVMQDIEEVLDSVEHREKEFAERRPTPISEPEFRSNVLRAFLKELFPFMTIRSIACQSNEGVRCVLPARNLPRFAELRDVFLFPMSVKEGTVLECKVLDKEYWNVRRPPQQQFNMAAPPAKPPPPSLSIRCVLSCTNQDIGRVPSPAELGYQVDPRCVLDDELRRIGEYLSTRLISNQFADAVKPLSAGDRIRQITHPNFRCVDGTTAAQVLVDGLEPGMEDDGSFIVRPHILQDPRDRRRGFKLTWKMSSENQVILHEFVTEEGEIVGGEGGVAERLLLRGDTYSELDDVAANYVARCADLGSRMMQHRSYFHVASFTKKLDDSVLRKELERRTATNAGTLAYILSAAPNSDPNAAFTFCLSYQLPGRDLTKILIRLTPSGFRLAGRNFVDPLQLTKWWKRHLRKDFAQLVNQALSREREAARQAERNDRYHRHGRHRD